MDDARSDDVFIPSDQIILDPEFVSLVPPLAAQQEHALEQDLIAKGCRDALIVWRRHELDASVLLDGRYRLAICTRLRIPLRCQVVYLTDREAARAYLIDRQLGNPVTPESASYMRGCHYRSIRQSRGGNRRAKESNCQRDSLNRAQRLTQLYHHVSERTILRDAAFADIVDAVVQNCGPEAKPLILARYGGLSKRGILRLSRRTIDAQRTFIQILRATGKALKARRGKSEPRTITLPLKEFSETLIRRWGNARAVKLAQKILEDAG